ncbi:substrate-binding family protein [Kineococcus rhizosphaerae]|uniref:Substrate-binding family protein n=1 Tax=Kineococcus rhizosphaerae TaxID=559628 RepID=A0A2T0QUU2_9ACTN|nr:substrate-binding family protein [Kineococcus rhizosphaerae]
MARRGTPFVMVNRRLQGHPSVTTDDVRGGELAAAHLLRLGHLRVGVVAGHSHASTNVERVHGFTRTLRRAGVEVEERLVVDSDSDVDGGYAAATHILQTEPHTTAIFAINDFAAIGAMGAARERGRRPGQDIAVIGYNDIPLVRHLPVPLTSVSSPMERMGRRGADLLCQIIDGADVEAELLEPTLIERESTTGVLSPT